MVEISGTCLSNVYFHLCPHGAFICFHPLPEASFKSSLAKSVLKLFPLELHSTFAIVLVILQQWQSQPLRVESSSVPN